MKNKLLFTILSVLNKYLALNKVDNEARWITIHPHGNTEDENGKKDYRRLKIEDGETPREAIDRVFKKDNKSIKQEQKSFLDEHRALEKDYQDIVKKRNAIRDELTAKLQKFREEHPKFSYERAEKEFKKENADEVQAKEKQMEDLYSEIIDADTKIDKLHQKEAERLDAIKIDDLSREEIEKFLNDYNNVHTGRLDYNTRSSLANKKRKAEDRIKNLDYLAKRKELKKINGIKKGSPMSHSEADNGKVNPNYNKGIDDKGYSTNCQSCVTVYELRRRGFDIEVKPKPKTSRGKMALLSRRPELAYIDTKTGETPEVTRMYVRDKKEAYYWLNRNIQEGRYVFRVVWNIKSGHIISAERINDKMVLYDPQTNITYDNEEKILDFLTDVQFEGSEVMKPFILRVDDLDIKQDFADAITVKK